VFHFLRERQSCQRDRIENEQGRGVLGVIDGASPKGVETTDDAARRRDFLTRSDTSADDRERTAVEDVLAERSQADARAMAEMEGDLLIRA
jgi:hypothetical protein